MPSRAIVPSRLVSTDSAFIFLAGILFLIWGFVAYDLNRLQNRDFAHARTQLQNLTHVYSEEVASSINKINYVLVDLRDEWKGDPAAFDAHLLFRQVHLDPSIAFNVGIIDAQGKLVYTSTDLNAQHVDLSDREHFKFHYRNRGDGLFISEPVLLRLANRLAIQFTRPLPAERGKFNGVIVVSVSPEYFSRFHERIDLGKDSSIALARIHGDLLARYPEPDRLLEVRIQDAPWIGKPANDHGFFHKDSAVDEVERLYAWRVLEDGNMAVVMGQSADAILARYHQQRRTYLIWGSAATLLLLLAAYAIGEYRLQRAQANAAMQQMEEALARSQKLESIGKLTGGVAHDFNNILQIISSTIQVLEGGAQGNKEMAPHLEAISDAVERGSSLTSQLLTFARRQPLEPVVVDLEKLIQGLDSLIQPLVGPNIKVQTSSADDLWTVRVDHAMLGNVILNLATNARDAMHGTGTLSISLTNESVDDRRVGQCPGITTGEYVMLAISDTGSGMPPEVLEHVFEPFFTTKPEGKGTGLGLSMAYGFVKESGGHIYIDSEVGAGTIIRIFLPRTTAAQETTFSVSNPPQTVGGTETILVVDDNAELRRMARFMLEQLGYSVLEAPHTQAALETIQNSKSIDVLFTDVLMPGGMDGVELAKQAKAIHPELAILLTSGSYDRHESLKGLQAEFGGIDFLEKPYRIEQVDAAVHKLLLQKDGSAYQD